MIDDLRIDRIIDSQLAAFGLLQQLPRLVGAFMRDEDLHAAYSINRNPVSRPQRLAADLRRDPVRFKEGAYLLLGELTLDRGHGNERFHAPSRHRYELPTTG